MIKKEEYLQELESAIQSREVFASKCLCLGEQASKGKDKHVLLRVQIDYIKRIIKDKNRTAVNRFLALLLLQQTSEYQDYDYMLYLKNKILLRMKKMAESKGKEKEKVSDESQKYEQAIAALNIECLLSWGQKYEKVNKLTGFHQVSLSLRKNKTDSAIQIDQLVFFRDYVFDQLCSNDLIAKIKASSDFSSQLQYFVFSLQLQKQPADLQERIFTMISQSYQTQFNDQETSQNGDLDANYDNMKEEELDEQEEKANDTTIQNHNENKNAQHVIITNDKPKQDKPIQSQPINIVTQKEHSLKQYNTNQQQEQTLQIQKMIDNEQKLKTSVQVSRQMEQQENVEIINEQYNDQNKQLINSSQINSINQQTHRNQLLESEQLNIKQQQKISQQQETIYTLQSQLLSIQNERQLLQSQQHMTHKTSTNYKEQLEQQNKVTVRLNQELDTILSEQQWRRENIHQKQQEYSQMQSYQRDIQYKIQERIRNAQQWKNDQIDLEKQVQEYQGILGEIRHKVKVENKLSVQQLYNKQMELIEQQQQQRVRQIQELEGRIDDSKQIEVLHQKKSALGSKMSGFLRYLLIAMSIDRSEDGSRFINEDNFDLEETPLNILTGQKTQPPKTQQIIQQQQQLIQVELNEGYLKMQVKLNKENMIDELVRFKQSALLPEGTVFENKELKVNYITQLQKQTELTGTLNIINKTPFMMTIQLKCHNPNDFSINLVNTISQHKLQGNSQVAQQFIIRYQEMEFQAFLGQIYYSYQGKNNQINLVVPCLPNKFFTYHNKQQKNNNKQQFVYKLLSQKIELNQQLIPDNYALQRYIPNLMLTYTKDGIDNYSFDITFQDRQYNINLHIDTTKQLLWLTTEVNQIDQLTQKFLNLYSFLLSLYK